MATPTYQGLTGAMLGGVDLQAELGVPDSERRMQAIIDKWLEGIRVEIKGGFARKIKLTAKLRIQLLNKNWIDEGVRLSMAQQETEKGAILPWLDWLLTYGDRAFIIKDYKVQYGNFSPAISRTGRAIMLEDETRRWRVPPIFRNFPSDNFVTQAIERLQEDVEGIVKYEIGRRFK
jgi:hypothetical protein